MSLFYKVTYTGMNGERHHVLVLTPGTAVKRADALLRLGRTEIDVCDLDGYCIYSIGYSQKV